MIVRSAQDLKDMGFLKYYRLIRKWASKQFDISPADLEVLIYLAHMERFTRKEFEDGCYIFSWDKHRWDRMRKQGWIETWRHRNRKDIKFSIFMVSHKGKHLVARIYRILWGEEDAPQSIRSKIYYNSSYTDKILNKSLDDMIKDPNR